MLERVTILVLLLLLPCLSTVLAQKAANESHGDAAALPTVDEVLDRYVKALGGRAAIEKIKSSVAKGTMEIPAAKVSGTVEFWKKAPNMLFVIANIGDSGANRSGFDGSVGWTENPHSGLMTMHGQQLAQLALQADFYRSINLKQLYPKMVLTGLQKDGDSEAYVIEATAEGGRSVKLHFDKATGLLVRTDSGAVGQESEYLEDYREVDGVKTPFLMREVTPAVTVIIKLTEIKNNVAIDNSKFLKPQGK